MEKSIVKPKKKLGRKTVEADKRRVGRAIYFPKSFWREITEAADAEKRSVRSLIEVAVSDYIKRNHEQK